MCKISHFSDNSQENSGKITFSSVKNIKVEATTDAMSLSSHGGLLLLQREEEHLALASQLASCVHDSRTPYLIKHSLTEIIMIEVSHPNGPRFEKSTGSGETPVTREFTLYLQRGG